MLVIVQLLTGVLFLLCTFPESEQLSRSSTTVTSFLVLISCQKSALDPGIKRSEVETGKKCKRSLHITEVYDNKPVAPFLLIQFQGIQNILRARLVETDWSAGMLVNVRIQLLIGDLFQIM